MDCIRVHCTGSFTGVATIGGYDLISVYDIISYTSAHLLVFRELSFCFQPHGGVRLDFAFTRVPFFFEPNFDALIKPLDAALRMQAEDSNPLHPGVFKQNYEPVRYGEFLKKKVGSNFDTGKGRYD